MQFPFSYGIFISQRQKNMGKIIIVIIKRDLISVLSNCQGLIKDTKRTRGRLDRNVAPCSRPITTAIGPLHECKRKCVHAQKPYPAQAFAHESSKVGGRGKRETEARRLMERKTAQQKKKRN